jgi:LDH2 family malate/lactate/ureidoglycolate dehydrogenase
MAYVKFGYPPLRTFCEDVFEGFGFSESETRIITDVVLTADLFGIESHGIQHMVLYYSGIKKGMIDVKARPETVFETPLSAVVDGHGGMGQVIAFGAMRKAIEKARDQGIGIVVARNSNHFGIAGYYAKMACDEGFLGLSFTNSQAIMVPTFGRLPMLGSNPIACAMPAEPFDFFFDAATTVVPRGKLEVYGKEGKALPDGWALDKKGNPSRDAADVLKNINAKAGGGIMPLGGNTEISGSHKGYGYGMICEIFTSILSLGTTSNYCAQEDKGGICHGFIAVNPNLFGDPEAIKKHLSIFLQELRESPKAEGKDRIYTHGEKEIEAIADRKKNGIPVNDGTMVELLEICEALGLDFASYFGDYMPSEEAKKGKQKFY